MLQGLLLVLPCCDSLFLFLMKVLDFLVKEEHANHSWISNWKQNSNQP